MDDAAQRWLTNYLAVQHAMAGTVHLVAGDTLELAAAVNIPEPVVRATARIPRGKGMAGLAFERDQPVSTCNLQEASSEVRPGARAVGAGAAVAFPVHDAAGRVRAIVGVAFAEARTLGDQELAALASAARGLPGDGSAGG